MPEKPFRRFFSMIKADKKDIYYIYLFAILNGVINLSLPLGIQAIINLVMGGRVSSSFILLVSVVLLGIIFTGILQILQMSITELIQQRLFARSAFEFSYRIPRIKTQKLLQYHPPELVNRFFDTLTVQKGLPKILMDVSTSLLQIFFGLLLLSFYHPFFIMFGAFLVVLVVLIFRFTGPNGLRTSLLESDYKYKVAFWLEELARNFGSFKQAGKTDLPNSRTDEYSQGYLENRKAHFKVLMQQFAGIIGFKVFITGGLLLIGGLLVINNQINVGQFVASEIVILIIINSIEKLIRTSESIYDVITALEKIGKVTDMPLDNDRGLPLDEKGAMEVIAKGVSLQFDGDSNQRLNEVQFHLHPGEKIGLAGPHGSGKSVLLQTLAGFYPEVKGSLSYHGQPLGSLNLEELRNRIGSTLSMEELFYGTILENLTVGRPNISLEETKRVCVQLGLDDYIRSLPEGFNTKIIPGGRNLGRGITMRLLIARSILGSPELLLLGNEISSLDPSLKKKLIHFLLKEMPDTSLVMINHDPEILQLMDRVWVMGSGSIVADGPWDQVRSQCKYLQPE